jgi:hypothetical protein
VIRSVDTLVRNAVPAGGGSQRAVGARGFGQRMARGICLVLVLVGLLGGKEQALAKPRGSFQYTGSITIVSGDYFPPPSKPVRDRPRISKELAFRYRVPNRGKQGSPFFATRMMEQQALAWFGLPDLAVTQVTAFNTNEIPILGNGAEKIPPVMAPADLYRALAILAEGAGGRSELNLASILERRAIHRLSYWGESKISENPGDYPRGRSPNTSTYDSISLPFGVVGVVEPIDLRSLPHVRFIDLMPKLGQFFASPGGRPEEFLQVKKNTIINWTSNYGRWTSSWRKQTAPYLIASGAEATKPSAVPEETKATIYRSRFFSGFLGLLNEASLRDGVLWQDATVWGQRGYLFSESFKSRLWRTYGVTWPGASFLSAAGREELQTQSERWGQPRGLSGAFNPSVPNDVRLRLLGQTSTRLRARWDTHVQLAPAEAKVEGFLPSQNSLPSTNGLVRVLQGSGRVGTFETDHVDAVLVRIEKGLSLLVVMAKNDLSDLTEQFMSIRQVEWGAKGYASHNSEAMSPLNEILRLMVPAEREFIIPQFDVPAMLTSTESLDGGTFLRTYRWNQTNTPGSDKISRLLDENLANFSRVNGQGFLFLEGLSPTAGLRVDHRGVEGTASTAFRLKATKDEPLNLWRNPPHYSSGVWLTVIGSFYPPPPPPADITLRPFFYAVVVEDTGTVLFCGAPKREHLTPTEQVSP